MNDAIIVNQVSKKFKVHHDKSSTLKEKILFQNRNSHEDRWVLNNINLNIKKGECIGLIGENGSGKSTLLKLMTRIIYPSSGSIEIGGKVSSLLELGAGFHPDMSGLENIYTNASIFGLSRKEIDERIQEIIAFSELEDFIDNPVRTYSSGMYMRLAFSVAINVEADILLVDEILAVGDANFQKKCFEKMKKLKRNKNTIVIVSHDLASLQKICDKVIWIQDGEIKKIGEARKICDEYMLFMGQKEGKKNLSNDIETNRDKEISGESKDENISNNNRWGNKKVEITEVKILDANNFKKNSFETGEKIILEMFYKVNENINNPIIGVQIFTSELINCFGTHTQIDNIDVELKKTGKIRFIIEESRLINGRYFVDVAITDEYGVPCDYHSKLYEIVMYSNLNDIGIYRPKHIWEVK